MESSIKIMPAAILGFFIGALALCLEIFFQQALIGGTPLLLKSYLIPITYGGVSGILISIIIVRRQNILTERLYYERNNNRQLRTKLEKTSSVLSQLNAKLKKEVAENTQTAAALRKTKHELSQLIENEANTNVLGNVLVVDDDVNYLNVLENSLNNADFGVYTALSSEEGLQKICETHFDLVILNYKMSDRNGTAFLKSVKNDHPEINRAILGDYEYQPSVDRIISEGLASTVFIKHRNKDLSSFEKDIDRVLKLKNIFNGEKIKALVSGKEKVIKLPNLFIDFSDAVRKELNFLQLAEIINKNSFVAAKLLQYSKMSFYGNNKKTSLEETIMMHGENAIRDIILLASLFERGARRSSHNHYFQKLMNHLAVVNKYLEPLSRIIYGKSIEKNYKSIGLTHDIGQIILMQHFPDRFDKIVSYKMRNPQKSFYDCEIDLGYADCSHAEIGAYFLNLWNFPEISVEAALYHHSPSTAENAQHMEILRLLSFANEIVNYLTRKTSFENINYNEFLKSMRKELY